MALSLTGKQWIYPKQRDTFSTFADILMRERNLANPPLHRRPLFNAEQHAIKRIRYAIERHEHIGIFGDYDCDGITATALMVRFFRRKGIDPVVRLPHRNEGYGLHPTQVDAFKAQRVSLIITVDTGVTAFSAVRHANANNMDVLIIDHHSLPAILPPAYAIIHPHLANPPFDPPPSAAGICYLFIRALEGREWNTHESDIALASLGVIADLVELKGYNRTIAREGLNAWNCVSHGPLAELKRSAALHGQVSGTDIAFRLAPRINAAGRMDDPLIALTALLEGGSSIDALEQLNRQRRLSVEEIYTTLPQSHPHPWICLAHPDYHPGMIGLIAGKLTERFYRPSLVAHIRDGICTASLRSIPTINIMDALEDCKELLIHFGGHAQAAGCTFNYKNFPLIQQKLSQFVSAILPLSDPHPPLAIDAELRPEDITIAFCRSLERLEPFGQGNPEPRFLLRNIYPRSPRHIGTDEKHLRFWIGNIPVVGFGLGSFLPNMMSPVDLVCRLSINDWNDKKNPQLFIDDLHLATNNRPNRRVSWAPLVEDTI